MAKLLKKYKFNFVVGFLFKMLEAILELFLPAVMALAVDAAANGKLSGHRAAFYGFAMLAMCVLGFAFACICQNNAAFASQGFGTNLRNLLYFKILNTNLETTENFGAATLMSRIVSDTNTLQTMVAMTIRQLSRAPLICIGAFVTAFLLSPRLSLIILASLPVLSALVFIITKITVPLYKNAQNALDNMQKTSLKYLFGIKTISVFNGQKKEADKLEEAANLHSDRVLKSAAVSALLSPATALVLGLSMGALLLGGFFEVRGARLSAGEMTAFVSYVTLMSQSVFMLSNFLTLVSKAAAARTRVNEVLLKSLDDTHAEKPDFSVSETPLNLDKRNVLEVKNLSFLFENGGFSIKNISFSLKPGESLGISGVVASGKTTLLQLIAGLYEPKQGEVLLGQKNINSFARGELADFVGYVTQIPEIFDLSVTENIQLGAKGATDEDIARAMNLACIDFAFEPNGTSKMCGQNGAELSGGQKQRVAIARALAKPHPLLLFDDSLSALDSNTAEKVLKNILLLDCAKIIVSQRAWHVEMCNQKLILDNGEIKCAPKTTK